MIYESFVYVWKDLTNNRYYIGKHKGTIDDGYICSSKYFLKEYKERPHEFVRKIIKTGTDRQMFDFESELLKKFNVKNNDKFYNKYNNIDKFYNDGSEEIKEATRQTCLRRYGVDSPAKIPAVKEKMSKAARSKEKQDKIKKTLQKRYGVSHPTHIEAAILKKKNTWKKKYGFDEVLKQGSVVRQKQDQTKIRKYNTSNVLTVKSVREKIKKTNIEKYGVDNIFKDPNFQKSVKDLTMKKYGVTNIAKLPEIQQKKKDNHIKISKLPQNEFILYVTSHYKNLYQRARGGNKIINVVLKKLLNLREDSDEVLIKLKDHYDNTNTIL